MKTLMLFGMLISLSALSQAQEGVNAMLKVQAGAALEQAIDAIPIDLATALDLEQERGLRDWLHQYLIAFSESGNDSLVAAFYLRAGFDKERYIAQSLMWTDSVRENARNPSINFRSADGTILTSEEEIEKAIQEIVDEVKAKAETALKEGALPLFRSMHKGVLKNQNKEYLVENVSFHDSSFRIFELGKEDPTFLHLASDRGMLPDGHRAYSTGLGDKLPALLATGEKIICADILFSVEEPLEFTPNPAPRRTSSFFRLLWDQDKKLWRHLEVFYSPGSGGTGTYFFNLL